MSSKSKAGKSVAGGKFVGPFVPEPLPPVTPIPVGTDPKSLPFLEWSDQELNTEKWDMPKAKDKAKQKPSQTMKKTPSSTPAQFPLVNNPDEPLQFVDPHLVHLPHSLAVHEWKRPSEVFPDANFIIYKESSEYPDLISGSKHLLHSDFMRSFISAIGILEYLGNTRPSPIEFASPTFVPNTSDEPWRPWHHIYSMCKAGKGQKHNPQVNTLGKYVVRLFWVGCWRRVVIDDLLPVDLTNHVLLPTLDKPHSAEATVTSITSASKSTVGTSGKKGQGSKTSSTKTENATTTQKQIEMWPFLLCKALLKISSLTSTRFNEILDFDIIHCLTGWFVQKIEVTGLDVLDIWDMCAGYSDHYTWPDPNQKQTAGKGPKNKTGKESKSTSKSSSKSASGGKNVSNFLDGEGSGIIPYHLLATCADMRTVLNDEVPDVAPCWSHHILIDQTRNIPLIKPDPLPELARWKRFRWLAWAIRKGAWPAPELVPIKCLKMVSVFKKCAEHVVYKPPSKEAIDIKKSVAIIEELALKMGDGKMKAGKDKGKKTEKPEKSSKDSSKSSKGSKGKKGIPTVELPPDPSIWGDFNKLGPYISCLYIFFKSSRFNANVKITNISQSLVGKDGGKGKPDKGKKGKLENTGQQLLMWNRDLLISRNEPVYLFIDSIDYKLIVVNFAQVGNADVLENPNTAHKASASTIQENSLIEPYSPNQKLESFTLLADEDTYNLKLPKLSVPFAYIVIENYSWQTSKVGDMTTFLNTYGTKTMLVDVKPGRFVMRMWIKSDTPYNINLMSDTPLVAGTLEVVLENMSHEPERLLKMCNDISSTYGQLVQKFGTPEFVKGLISFCQSYLPEKKLSKLQLSHVHNVFLEEFLNTVNENSIMQEIHLRVFALKVLFMNPDIKLKQYDDESKKKIDSNLSEQFTDDISYNSEMWQDSEGVDLAKKTENAAVTLQAFFKKLYVKKLRALHSQTHKDYMKIFDALKKIYSDNLSISKRMAICPPLIRNFLLSNSSMYSLRDHYPLLDDLNSCVYLQHFTGTVIPLENTWLPITKHVFYCNSPNMTIIKICLFCGLPKYMVRVFDNDTNKEIQRFTNNAIVHGYTNNALGYTVLCYGWSENASILEWKLDFITLKQKTSSLIIVPHVTIHNSILMQNYRPNIKNIICRCIVSIKRDTLVSFRLSVSHADVKLYLRCLNELGQIVGEICGTQPVILPAIFLKYVEGLIEDETESATSSITQSCLSKIRKMSKNKLRSGSLVRTSTNTSIRKRSKHLESISLDKFSVTSEKKSRSSKISQDTVKSIKYRETVYIVEAFVIDHSWPLNKPEWTVVKEIKARSLLGPLVVSSTNSLSSAKQVSVRRSLDGTRKLSDKSKQSSDIRSLENPIWVLETISNIEDSVVATVDTRREEEIKNIKRQWYEQDPERYEKSIQLREAYLQSHYIPLSITPLSSSYKTSSISSGNERKSKAETSSLKQDVEVVVATVLSKVLEVHETISANNKQTDLPNAESSSEENFRTLANPVSKTKMLPPLNFEHYFREQKYKTALEVEEEEEELEVENEKHIKTALEEENLKIMREKAMADFKLSHASYMQDMQKYLTKQIATHRTLDTFYKECRNKSKEMMQEAYDLRDKVIDIIIEADAAKRSPPSGKTDKSSQKVKK